MKSIVEEASSISKAVEQAWKRAGQPTEFSIRIHELAEKNMFGFTSKPAKIALLYQEEHKNKSKPVSHTSSTAPIPSVSKPTVVKTAPKSVQRTETKNESKQIKQATSKPARTERSDRQESGETTEPWSAEMIAFASSRLQQLLEKLDIKNATFQTTPQRYHLKISFAKPIFEEEEKNRIFFRNCAHLILQATRNYFKRPLKGFKTILTTEQP